MKRGMPRGARGRGNPGQQHMGRPEDSGPLMTEHLHNLDLELELLKRKREMFEQQHLLMEEQRLSRERPSNIDQPRYFEQKRYDPPESSSNRNFSHLYNPTESRDFIPLKSDRKRPNRFQWEDDLPPKRFSGPNVGNVTKSFGSRLGPRQGSPRTEPQQSSSSFQRGRIEIDTNRHLSSKDELRPLMGESTRPPMRRPPLTQKHIQQRFRNDFKPTKVTKPKPGAKKPPNQLNTRPVRERRDLVTQASHSVKKVNESMILHANHEPSCQLTGRLELALGQIMKDLKRKYGEKLSYAHVFHQNNLQRLMKQMIRARIRSVMLGKVVGTCQEIVDSYRTEYPAETDEDMVKAALEAETISSKNLDTNIVETENPEKYFRLNTQKLLDLKLREMFNKLEHIYKVPGDKKFSEVCKDVKKDEDIDFTKDLTEEEVKECQDKAPKIKLENLKFSINDLEEMIQWRLPRILKRFTPYIIKILSLDKMYEVTKASIIMQTNAKAMALVKRTEKLASNAIRSLALGASEPQDRKPTEQPSTDTQSGNHEYLIKILARPTLPKRKLMQSFIAQFRPVSIKKHKNVHNLLFVVFSDKENYESILAEDGIVVGKSRLEIKVSEQKTIKKMPMPNDEDVQVIEDINKTINLDETLNCINSELDDQITDLLNSIREAEEQETECKRSDDAVMEVDSNGKDSAAESKIETSTQNESIEIRRDAEKTDEVRDIVSEVQNEPNDLEKEPEKPDKLINIISEGQNEPNDLQKEAEKPDNVINIISEGQNEPNDLQKKAAKPDEVINMVSEAQNEPNDLQKDADKSDEMRNKVNEGQNETNYIQKEAAKSDEVINMVSDGQNEPNDLQKDAEKPNEVRNKLNEGQNETNDFQKDSDKPDEVRNKLNKGQNETNDLQKDADKPDEVRNKLNEGQNETNDLQKEAAKPDEVMNIVSNEGLNKPNDLQKDVEKPEEVNTKVCEVQNEPNYLNRGAEKPDEVHDTVSEGDKKILMEVQEEQLKKESNHQKKADSETNNKKETEKEPNAQKETKKIVENTNDDTHEKLEKRDVVTTLKSDKDGGRSTPTRSSARIANSTPSTIRTRRASRLEQLNKE